MKNVSLVSVMFIALVGAALGVWLALTLYIKFAPAIPVTESVVRPLKAVQADEVYAACMTYKMDETPLNYRKCGDIQSEYNISFKCDKPSNSCWTEINE